MCFVCSYSSLDRKSQKLRVQRQALQTAEQPTKSTSLGSFNFITKPDEPFDPNANENKRCSREKQWLVYKVNFQSKSIFNNKILNLFVSL